MFNEEQKKLLNDKLEMSAVKKPTGKFGPKGDYIEGWHAIAEANRIFGFDGWSYRIVDMKECHEPTKNEKGNFGVSFIARVEVSAGGVQREDIGYGSGFAGNIGDAYESATKEAITDALKRSLRSFGNPFGLALYDKSRENVTTAADKPQAKIAPVSNPAIDNLWAEINAISSKRGLESFWIDNGKIINGFDNANKTRFIHKKDELKMKYSDAVSDIQDAFPGSVAFSERDALSNPLAVG